MFQVKDTLTDAEVEIGLRNIVRENLAFQAMATFTGGVFLVSFATQLGASNFMIGLLAAIGPLAQLIQLPTIYLVDRIQNRRLICVSATTVARSMWLLIALIPFVIPGPTGLLFLFLGLGLHSGFAAISNCSWSSWMRDIVPQNRMGAFFSRRMLLAGVLGMVLNILAGLYLDQWQRWFPANPFAGYSILFASGAIFGLLGVYFFTARIPEPRMTPIGGHLGKMLALPFRERDFRNLIIFEGSWNFAVNLAAPFFTVYMLRWLNFDLSSIILLQTFSQIVNILSLRMWGRMVDRYSNKAVLSVCSIAFIYSIFAWTFTTMPGRYLLTVPLLVLIHLITGIATAGTGLASGNIGLKLAPRGQATAYLSARSLVNSASASIAPIIGGRFADFFEDIQLTVTVNWTSPGASFVVETLDFQHWDFFFFFAFTLGLVSIYRLALVRETGDVRRRVLIAALATEVGRGVRSFSSVGGLFQTLHFPELHFPHLPVPLKPLRRQHPPPNDPPDSGQSTAAFDAPDTDTPPVED